MRHFAKKFKSCHKAGKIVTKLAGLAQQHVDALQARHCLVFKIAIVPTGKSVFHVRRARSQCGCVEIFSLTAVSCHFFNYFTEESREHRYHF
jgi:hypothetical protein